MTTFQSDDAGYAAWVKAHPQGFIVNCFWVPTPNYLKLHRCGCPWITGYLRRNPTSTGYKKVCSTDISALAAWASAATGGRLDPCRVCNPQARSSRRSGDPEPEPPGGIAPAEARAVGVTTRQGSQPIEAGVRAVPGQISTGCAELDRVWAMNIEAIVRNSHIPIPDVEDDLNWHAFLGHSIDMQGFRAAEFAGVDPLTRPAPGFVALRDRGVGVHELASLWEIPAIRDHLMSGRWDEWLRHETLDLIRAEGESLGGSLADAFDHFPWRKYRWSVRALLQNSSRLRPFDFSFRAWLRHECAQLGAEGFPPADFRRTVRDGRAAAASLEQRLRERLEAEFYMVGPAMAAYMICDWQLWLWLQGRTEVFASFKIDRFHKAFVERFGRGIVPIDEHAFARWWLELHPGLPPRLANECIWLGVENKHVDMG